MHESVPIIICNSYNWETQMFINTGALEINCVYLCVNMNTSQNNAEFK